MKSSWQDSDESRPPFFTLLRQIASQQFIQSRSAAFSRFDISRMQIVAQRLKKALRRFSVRVARQ